MITFTPGLAGSSIALVSGARCLVVRLADEPETIAALWAAVTADNPQAVLEVLAANGLSKTPAFALVDLEPGAGGATTLKCIVRGDVTLEFATDTGARSIDSLRAFTWVEESVEGALSFTVSADAATSSALPIDTAAVWASTISWVAVSGEVAPPARVATAPPAVVASPVPAVSHVAEQSVAEQSVAEHTIAAHTMSEVPLDEPTGASAYDKLFEEETVVRSIEDAAVRPPDENATTEPDPLTGDHDGMTIMTSDLAKLRGGRKSKAHEPAEVPVAAPRYVLQLSTGSTEALEGTAIIGRAPSVSKVSGGTVPKLIAIPGNQDISRNHVQFSVEGDTVVVSDLNSRNGTTIVLPGKPPQLLRQGETTSVLAGTLVDLGGGITITVGEQS